MLHSNCFIHASSKRPPGASNFHLLTYMYVCNVLSLSSSSLKRRRHTGNKTWQPSAVPPDSKTNYHITALMSATISGHNITMRVLSPTAYLSFHHFPRTQHHSHHRRHRRRQQPQPSSLANCEAILTIRTCEIHVRSPRRPVLIPERFQKQGWITRSTTAHLTAEALRESDTSDLFSSVFLCVHRHS